MSKSINVSNISVNKQSSIRIAGTKILYFDAIEITEESHDADYIFVTHEHFDHYDPVSISKLIKEDTKIVVPETMKKKVLKELASAVSNDESRFIFCVPKTVLELDGVKFETVPAYNKLKPFHPKGNKWLGYIVKMDEVTYYVTGDTDATEEAKSVACDVALIPVGGKFTMDKNQAADLICEMKPNTVIPTHYGEIVGNPTDGPEFKKCLESMNPDIQVELKL